MSEDSREHDDQNAREHAARRDVAPETEGSASTSEQGATYPVSFTADARTTSRGNAPVRVAAMQRAQQTYGNRALQRFIQRSAASQTDVQRVDENAAPAAAAAPATSSSSAASGASSGGPAKLEGATVDISGGVVSINAPFTRVNGIIQADTLIATNVVGSNYTPGAGNVM